MPSAMDRNYQYLMPPAYGGQASSTGNSRSSPSPAPEGNEVPCSEALLNFKPSTATVHLQDHAQQQTGVSMSASLGGLFFLAESAVGDEASPEPAPTYLTCYRRNLFQVSGSVTISQGLRYILTDQGLRVPIVGQELVVSATESVQGAPVKLISVPSKSAGVDTSASDESKAEADPESISIDVPMIPGRAPSYVNFPFSWKRLQFRLATANNGRRRELQQSFVIHLRLNVILPNGARVGVCDARSDPVVVRGRSPRNFQSKKEYPLGVSSSRRNARHGPSSSISTSTDGSQTSDSPTSVSADVYRPGNEQTYRMQVAAQAPLQYLENSAPHTPAAAYAFDSSVQAGMPIAASWVATNSSAGSSVASSSQGSLFSPMAEMYLDQSMTPGPVGGYSSPGQVYSMPVTSAGQSGTQYVTPTTYAGSNTYQYPGPGGNQWQ